VPSDHRTDHRTEGEECGVQADHRTEGEECGDGDLQFCTNKRPVPSDSTKGQSKEYEQTS